ncbi:MAG: hypothetical protein IPP19_05605 [Verrucomicrobia bacterium]|nr:hypothetical protein [Verrucomicrobiota bacterium]
MRPPCPVTPVADERILCACKIEVLHHPTVSGTSFIVSLPKRPVAL